MNTPIPTSWYMEIKILAQTFHVHTKPCALSNQIKTIQPYIRT